MLFFSRQTYGKSAEIPHETGEMTRDDFVDEYQGCMFLVTLPYTSDINSLSIPFAFQKKNVDSSFQIIFRRSER